MKAGWKVKPLGDLVEISSGGTPSKGRPDFWVGEIPWVSPKDMKSAVIIDSEDHISEAAVTGSATRMIKSGSLLLVVRSGILARTIPVAVAGRDLTINQDIKALTPCKELHGQFLAYLLAARETELLDKVTRGATVHKLDTPVIRSLQIPLPPLEEQQQIVAVLDEAFEGLARARAHAEANLGDARELLNGAIRSLFRDSSDWPSLKISQIGEVFDGPHATPKTVDEGPLFLGISSLVDGRIELDKTRHVTEKDFATWTRRVAPKAGDVVFSYETRLGQVGLIPDGMKCCLGRRMGLVRLNARLINPEYFVLCYLSPLFQDFLKDKTIKGATVDRLSIKDFPQFPFPVPPMEIQDALVEKILGIRSMCDSLIVSVDAKLQDTEALRQSLLQKAFAGELT